ncbi:MAG: branched-chain amino acid ABC transporter permease [Candidatus Nanopelagicales bacterium]|nr:branched-chain amino acid ABC transporter permease [Candidatus Nanopelagicales bacterium]
MLKSLRNTLGVLLLGLMAFFVAGGFSPAHAADTTINGVLTTPAGTAVEGVVITVTAEDGFSGTATSGADGSFSVALPGGGTYTVEIDVASLPEGVTLAREDDASRSLLVLGGSKKLLIPLAEGGDTGGIGESAGGTGERIVQLFFDGILYGLLIALGAVGLNLVFGTTGLTNFSHGELLTLGAFTALAFNQAGLNIIIAAPIAIVFAAFVYGWGQNKILWRPLRRRKTGLIAAMIVSIGLAIVLRYTIALIFGSGPQTYLQFAGQEGISIGPFNTTPKALILGALAAVALTITVIWLQRSRIGKATRAVSDNPALASATGIDVERVIAVVWIVGAGLAAFAGIYLGMTQNSIWNMGQRILLVLFAAVILGGLGTIYGAIVGALVVGVFIQMTTLFIPTEMKTVGALFLMIIILLVRPQGLLGRKERVG